MTLNAVTSCSNTFYMNPKGFFTRQKKMKAKKKKNVISHSEIFKHAT